MFYFHWATTRPTVCVQCQQGVLLFPNCSVILSDRFKLVSAESLCTCPRWRMLTFIWDGGQGRMTAGNASSKSLSKDVYNEIIHRKVHRFKWLYKQMWCDIFSAVPKLLTLLRGERSERRHKEDTPERPTGVRLRGENPTHCTRYWTRH